MSSDHHTYIRAYETSQSCAAAACTYEFGFTDPAGFLATAQVLEVRLAQRGRLHEAYTI